MNGSLSSLIHRAVSLFVLPQTRWQLLILAGLLVVAWMLALLARRAIGRRLEQLRIGRRFGVESLYRAIFWLCGAGLIWPVRNIARPFIPTALLDLALVPVVGIGLIYLAFFLLRRVFGRDKRTHRLLAVSEGITTIVVWIGVVLRGLGLDDDVLRWSASVQFAIGQARFTLLAVVQAVLSVSVMLILALWLAIAFEDRIMRSPKLDANLKVFSVRIGRGAFVLTAVVMSLSMVGIDLTVLGMFSGALGVGLGFGLQKIASNYVSGFIVLADRSLRIGDTISVGGIQGRVTQIRRRYTVVRSLDGIETLIPNEKLITDVVQNHSSYLTRGYAKLSVKVAYTSDIELALQLLARAAQGVRRVCADPVPTSYLVEFGSDGAQLELAFWIEDAAIGTTGVRSDVNRNVWRLFGEHGIAIPPPQRDVRLVGKEVSASERGAMAI
ncbi:mechanosensitive ion channel family protein [Paraburkholderia sp. J63]|uniref:mechanosensitive ion channel family protein n=1 Tax=Paraburkholderia sp. J63 TaxID=2805434 RepID=UPI002ABD7ABB|nr:mechanosensitive ion channel domain-containing protein [Paraburkholderia sp. J63]